MIRGNWSGPETYFLRNAVFMIIAWALRFVQNRKFKNSVVPLRNLPLRSWLAFIGNGTVGVALGGVAFAMCIRVLPVSVVTPITASSPFITVLLARVFMKEKLTATQGAGIALVIAGSIAVSL
ncbi:EamA family transporter [Synergistaceae bacterium OttesenSCG-928-I11]|nr:EamA family transporter [Synergistaceae bacterium OttesenSCG-928-I11]